MIDLVRRLRAYADWRKENGCTDIPQLSEAASEIERLQAALRTIQRFFAALRDLSPQDPLYTIRERVHAPVLATIKAALAGDPLDCPDCNSARLRAYSDDVTSERLYPLQCPLHREEKP
jgi:hypothetical protein